MTRQRFLWQKACLPLACALALFVTLIGAPRAHAAPNGLPTGYLAPPPPAGHLADLGSPMSSLTVVEGAFGRQPDGALAAYAAPMGENSELNVSTVYPGTTTSLGRLPMQGSSGAPTIAVAPDQTVYAGTFYEGHLYAYSPATDSMRDLGQAVRGETYLYGLTVAPDGTVYGGTYPNAHAFSYHPDRGFTDLGRVSDDPAVQYVRSTVIDPEHNALYLGLQPVAKLLRMDLTTREVTEVPLTPVARATAISDLDHAQGRVFANVGGVLRVIDTTTNREVAFTNATTGKPDAAYPLSARGVSEARRGKVFFSSTQDAKVQVVAYDITTDTVARTGKVATRGALIGYGWNVEGGHDVLYGWAGNYSGGGFRYDLDTGASTSLQFSVDPAPSPLQHVLPSADGLSVSVNAFLNGNGVRRDVATGAYSPIARLGQVEDWTRMADGRIAAGLYPSGALLTYDPKSTAAGNPRTWVTLKETAQQIRPIDVQEHAGRVWAASEPDYGQRGGALTVIDTATGAVDTTRGIVPNHTLASLAFTDASTVLIGSSTEGGTGTEPVEGEAQLVEWDQSAKTVLRSLTPVPGAQSINALVRGPHGGVFGLADKTLFELDATTWRVRRTLTLPVHGGAPAGTGELVFHPNGYLYASVGHSMAVIDPLAFTARIETGRTHRLELSADRSLWTLLAPEGFTNYIHLGQYVPESTRCPSPDTRPTVTLFGRDSGVPNRFLVTGCTLQDLFPLSADGTRSYAGTVNPWLARLAADGVVSQSERDALWATAKRGGRR